MTPLIEIQDLKQHFRIKGGLFGRNIQTVKAVDGVSFTINKGETFGLVGESGREAIWKIEVEDFPAFILVDNKGNDFFKQIKPRCAGNCK